MKFSIKDFTFTEEILNGKLHFLCRCITLFRSYYYLNLPKPTQPAITCSKLTIETLEQELKYVQT